MPRRGPVKLREILPDPVFGSWLVSKVINRIMKDGKKSKAQKTFYAAMNLIEQKTGENPLDVFQRAVRNVMPTLETRPRRVGGAVYQVPMEVRPGRKVSLAIRWIVLYAREREGKSIEEKLANELIDASRGEGGAVRKKEEVHRIAEANKAFAHYRWH